MALVVSSGALLLSAIGIVRAEEIGVYEDWRTSRTIRSDRWTARDDEPAQDVRLEIAGHKLLMRQRREGATTTNVGLLGRSQVVLARNPSAIHQLEVDFKVRHAAVAGCTANPGNTRVRPAGFSMSAFNNGTPGGPFDRTGNHYVTVQVNREADSGDPEGVLTVQAFVFRCQDPTCQNPISNIFNLAAGTVMVGERFTLRALWDRPNARFLVGVDDGPDIPLAYAAGLDQGNARDPFTSISVQGVTANCTESPAITDVETAVREVRTNASALIP